jgi:endothelin-converting enzyme/putative endopeptidase
MRLRPWTIASLTLLSLFLAKSARASEAGLASTLETIDKSADPCVDFYQYSCGSWLKTAQIPPDQPRWGSFVELQERNRTILREILEKAGAGGDRRDPVDQKIGDYYASCMDETAADQKGLSPLQPELARIAAVKDKAGLIDAVARVHLIGPNPLFAFYSSPDLHDADQVIAYIDQGGLSLPDRDYYLQDNPKNLEMRTHLVEYASRLFRLDGQSEQQAAESAQTVLQIETALAKASMDRTLRRDPKTRDHKMSREQASALAPNFYLDRYFADIGAPQFSELDVANPDFFRQVSAVLESEPLESLKMYVRWQLLDDAAPWLGKAFVDANFKMQQALTGQAEIKPRWKRCVTSTDHALGEALGQRYVEQTFGPEAKLRMQTMVAALEKSLGEDIDSVPWMSPETKKQAHLKLAAIQNKIGYPDRWRDYGRLQIVRGDLVGNVLHATQFESERQIAKIGKPVDRNEWEMTPPTVNAYYSAPYNEIVFPAGILQPPFFNKDVDDAVNFGGIGLVIGHELTHGFDDQGRKYDLQGNLRNWWTEEDGKQFEQRASCVASEYSGFVAIDDLKLNGKLTLGENTADNGGARISLNALAEMNQQHPSASAAQTIDGYTPEQRFFLGFGRVWCEKQRPEFARMRVGVDPHSPGKYRVDGVVENMPEFEKAWSCKAGQPMVSDNACRVW